MEQIKNEVEIPVVPAGSLVEKSSKFPIVLLSIVLFVVLLLAGFLFYQNQQLKKPVTDQLPKEETNLLPSGIPTAVPTQISIKPSELVSLDNTWNLYSNFNLGFSLKVPKNAIGGAPCIWKGPEAGDHSYRPATGLVPVKVFEDVNGVYVNMEYRYQMTGETSENGRYFFSGCEKQMLTPEILKSESPQTWHIVSEKVTNDQELEAFIQKHFYPGCKLGQKKQSLQTGVFDVSVTGDSQPPDENGITTKCFINYMYVIKYSPEKQRVFTWDLGQSIKFSGSETENYDEEMVKSFKVL